MTRTWSRILGAVALVGTLLAVGTRTGAPPASAAPLPHPRLLFSAADVPGLQARIQSGVPAQAWASLKAKADSYTDPTSPNYVNPLVVNNPADNSAWNWYDGFLGQNQMGSYLTDMGFAYQLSGDPKYGKLAISLLLALSSHWQAWNNNELGRGDLTKGVGLAFDWTYDLMTPAERSTIVTSLAAQEHTIFSCLYTTFYFNPSPGFNWNSVCGGGNGLTLLAIEGEPGVPADFASLLDMARHRIVQTLPYQLGANGDWAEGIVYGGYGLHNALPFALAWNRNKSEDLLAQSPGIKQTARFLSYEQLPGRGMRFVPRNDSVISPTLWKEVLPMLWPAGSDPATVGWLWDHTYGAQGDNYYATNPPYVAHPVAANHTCATLPDAPGPDVLGQCWLNDDVFNILYYRSPADAPRADPATTGPRSQLYKEYGLVDFRTGWSGGSNEVTGTYEAKHDHPAGHFQEDMGHFNLYGYGTDFAVDSSYGHNYSCSSATAIVQGGCTTVDAGHAIGHNVPIIDGSHTTQQPWGPLATNHNSILEYLDSPDATTVRSDLRSAYSTNWSGVPLAGRDLLFSRAPGEPVLFAVTDHLNKDGVSHSYAWQLNTNSTNPVALTGLGSFLVSTPSGAAMAGAVADAGGAPTLLALPSDSLRSNSDGIPQHTSITSTRSTSRIDHLAVLALTKPGASSATATPLAGATNGSAVEVTWAGGSALVAGAANPGTLMSVPGRIDTDAALAKVTATGPELLMTWGSSVVIAGVPWVTVTGGPSTVSLSGPSITAQGPVGATYRVHAPAGVTSVTVNGTALTSWTQSGPDVVFTA